MNQYLFVILYLAGLVVAMPAEAQKSTGGYEKYEATRNIAGELFAAGYMQFGNRLRAASILKACEKAGIAKSIDVATNERASYLRKELVRMGSLNDENAKFVKALSTEEIMALILGVSDQLLTYQIGYGDAIERLRPMLPGACEFGLKSADEILQEKK